MTKKTGQNPQSGPDASLDEIAGMVQDALPEMPPVTKGGDLLGKYKDVWRWLAAAQYGATPAISRPRIALFTAMHGAFPEEQAEMSGLTEQLGAGDHALCALAQESNADLQVYELNVDTAPRDFQKEPALLPHEAGHAASYGLMAVQPGIDLLVLAALNPVAAKTGEKIIAGLKAKKDPFDTLSRFGGLDIAAMTGAIIAARLAHIPVLLDGAAALAAAGIVQALRNDAAAHTRSAADILQDKMHPQAGMTGALLVPFLKSLAKAG